MLAENLADNVSSPIQKALPSVPQEGAIVVDETEFIPSEQAVSLDKSVHVKTISHDGPDVGDEDFDMEKEVDEEDDETTIAADEALLTEDEKKEELNLLKRESELPIEELLKLYKKDGEDLDLAEGSIDDESEVSDEDQSDEEAMLPQISVPARSIVEDGPDVGGDEDFDMDKETEEEDDKTTIAADEALITEDEKKEELNLLQRESELSLEELLKLYRRNGENLDEVEDPAVDDSEFSDEDESEDTDGSNEDESDYSDVEMVEEGLLHQGEDEAGIVQGNGTSNAHLSPGLARVRGVVENGIEEMSRKQPAADQAEASSQDHVGADCPVKVSMATTNPGGELQSVEHDMSKKDSKKLNKSTGLGASGSQRGSRCPVDVVPVEILLQRSQDLLDDGEYIPATSADGIEEDDETTMEEEERLAIADTDDPAAEVDRLKRESEMSVEELLAQYKLMAAADDGNKDSDEYAISDEDEDDFMEDRRDRTCPIRCTYGHLEVSQTGRGEDAESFRGKGGPSEVAARA